MYGARRLYCNNVFCSSFGKDYSGMQEIFGNTIQSVSLLNFM